MMMISSIIAGDYKECGIDNGKSLFHGPTGLELTTKPDISGKNMGVRLNKYTISSIEDLGSESKNSVAASVFGSILFGPAGLLLGGNNNRHIVAIYWKDGKKSLADLNDIDYREIKKLCSEKSFILGGCLLAPLFLFYRNVRIHHTQKLHLVCPDRPTFQ